MSLPAALDFAWVLPRGCGRAFAEGPLLFGAVVNGISWSCVVGVAQRSAERKRYCGSNAGGLKAGGSNAGDLKAGAGNTACVSTSKANETPLPSARDLLARNLVRLRGERGWSQDELARQAGIHRTVVAHIERSRRNVSIDSIEKFACAFDEPISQLLRNFD